MTDVLVRLTTPSSGALASGWVPADEVAAVGHLECRPYAPDADGARQHLDGPDRLLLPASMPPVRLVAGEALLHLAPTAAWWCWQIVERTSRGVTRYVSVPDVSTTIDYAPLVDVDPATLDPAVAAVPAWEAAVTLVQASAAAAAASAVEADGSAQDAAESAGLAAGSALAAADSADRAAGSESAAAASAGEASGHAATALGARDAALGAQSAAELAAASAAADVLALTAADVLAADVSRQGAETAQGLAEDAQAAAETAQGLAESARDTAAGHAADADADRIAAQTARTGAETARSGAEDAATQAAATLANVVPKALVDAKGDILTATADNTPARLAVGTGQQVLMPDTGAATGLAWTAARVLTGTGSPLGVVTPAYGGQLYADLAQTNGARVWISTGTTAASWAVMDGDTGWRVLTSWDTAGTVTGTALPANVAPTAGTAGSVRIRRINDKVLLRIAGATFSGGTSFANPTGFRPGLAQYCRLAAVFTFAVSYIAVSATTYDCGVAGLVASAANPPLIVHPTDSAWPTGALPGVAG